MVQRTGYCHLERSADPSSLSRPRLFEEPKVASDSGPKKYVKDLSTASFETILQLLGEPVEDAESTRVTPHLLVGHILCAVMDVQSCTQLFDPSASPSISLLLQFWLAEQASTCMSSSW